MKANSLTYPSYKKRKESCLNRHKKSAKHDVRSLLKEAKKGKIQIIKNSGNRRSLKILISLLREFTYKFFNKV